MEKDHTENTFTDRFDDSAPTYVMLARQIERLADAIDDLRTAMKQGAVPVRGNTRYTCANSTHQLLIGEKEMADRLNIPHRTLATYRRQGKFPGCWIKNGNRVFWRVEDTLAAWSGGNRTNATPSSRLS